MCVCPITLGVTVKLLLYREASLFLIERTVIQRKLLRVNRRFFFGSTEVVASVEPKCCA